MRPQHRSPRCQILVRYTPQVESCGHALYVAPTLSRTSLPQTGEGRQAGVRPDEQSRERLREGTGTAAGRDSQMERTISRTSNDIHLPAGRQGRVQGIPSHGRCGKTEQSQDFGISHPTRVQRQNLRTRRPHVHRQEAPLRLGLCPGSHQHQRPRIHHPGMGAPQLSRGGICHHAPQAHPLRRRLRVLHPCVRPAPQPQAALRLRLFPHLQRRTPARAGGTGSGDGQVAARHFPYRRRQVAHLPVAGLDVRPFGSRTHSGHLSPAVAHERPGR